MGWIVLWLFLTPAIVLLWLAAYLLGGHLFRWATTAWVEAKNAEKYADEINTAKAAGAEARSRQGYR